MASLYPIYNPLNPGYEQMRRKVVRKIDLHTVPPLALLYIACFIDRSNIGNAKVAGLEKDLGLQGIQFNITLAVFYITYILVELPSNHILRCVGAKIWLPLLVFCWGLVTVFSAFVKNFSSLIVIRMLLGFFEGGLLPGTVMFLSTIYKGNELQLRVGLFFCSSALSGAFGGLIAFGIQKMDGIGGKPAWAWIFILEGLVTIVIAIVGWTFLFSSLESARFLDATERDFAVNRLRITAIPQCQSDSLPLEPKNVEYLGKVSVDSSSQGPEDEPFEWKEVIRGFQDPQVWFIGFAGMTSTVAIYSLGFFLPTLVKGMGHTGAQAQLFSAFPYMPSVLLIIAIACLADKWQTRGPIVLALLPITMAGYLMLILAENVKIRYAGVFLVIAGVFPSSPCLLCILPSNVSGRTKLATVTALQVMLGNLSGFVSPFIFTPEQAPRYVKGHTISLAFICACWTLVAANVLYCRKENAAKMAGQRDYLIEEHARDFNAGKTQAPIGDRDPNILLKL